MNTTIDLKTAKTIEAMNQKINHMDNAVTDFFNKMSDIAERKYGDPHVYLAAVGPARDLSAILLEEALGILPCFDEDDAYLNIPDSSLLLSYNPAQVLKLAGKRYLTGPVILVRTNMDGEFISLTIDQVYLFQKYLMRHSVTLMADGQKLPCICME